MKRKRSILIPLIMLAVGWAVCVLFLPGTAAAQRRGDAGAGVEAVGHQLERTDRILQETRDQVGPDPGPIVARRLETALALQTRAWEMYRSHRLRPALKLTLEARTTSLRPGHGRRGRGPGATWIMPDRGERLERVMDRLGRALERLGERVDPANQAAREQLDLARSSYAAAQGAIRDQRWMLAEREVRQTREALLLTAGTVERDLRRSDIATLMEDAQRRHEEIAAPVHENGSAQLEDWLKQSGDDLHAADAALASGALRQALAQTRAALSLMDRIAEELGL